MAELAVWGSEDRQGAAGGSWGPEPPNRSSGTQTLARHRVLERPPVAALQPRALGALPYPRSPRRKKQDTQKVSEPGARRKDKPGPAGSPDAQAGREPAPRPEATSEVGAPHRPQVPQVGLRSPDPTRTGFVPASPPWTGDVGTVTTAKT